MIVNEKYLLLLANFNYSALSPSQDVLSLFNGKKRFILVGHSFGGYVAIEVAKLLEKNGLTGQVVSIDGSVTVFKNGMKKAMPDIVKFDEHVILATVVSHVMPEVPFDVILKKFAENKTWDEQFDALINVAARGEYSIGYLKAIVVGITRRIKMCMSESDEYSGDRIQSNITLIRPTTHLVPDVDNDYNLKQYTNGRVLVSFIEGNHMTMLDNVQLYQIINNICTG